MSRQSSPRAWQPEAPRWRSSSCPRNVNPSLVWWGQLLEVRSSQPWPGLLQDAAALGGARAPGEPGEDRERERLLPSLRIEATGQAWPGIDRPCPRPPAGSREPAEGLGLGSGFQHAAAGPRGRGPGRGAGGDGAGPTCSLAREKPRLLSGAARRHRPRPRTGNLGSPSRARGRPGAAATPWLGAPGRARMTPGHTRRPDCLEAQLVSHQSRLPKQPGTRRLTHARHPPVLPHPDSGHPSPSLPNAGHPPASPQNTGHPAASPKWLPWAPAGYQDLRAGRWT